MSMEHRRNPDSKENQKMTRENDAYVAMLQSPLYRNRDTICRYCKAEDSGNPCADCLNDQHAT